MDIHFLETEARYVSFSTGESYRIFRNPHEVAKNAVRLGITLFATVHEGKEERVSELFFNLEKGETPDTTYVLDENLVEKFKQDVVVVLPRR